MLPLSEVVLIIMGLLTVAIVAAGLCRSPNPVYRRISDRRYGHHLDSTTRARVVAGSGLQAES